MNTNSIDSLRRAAGLLVVSALAASMLACTSMGVGSGSMSPGNTPVSFNWTSKDSGTTGTMSATLGDGTAFSGPFVQMTGVARTEVLEPMWRGWHRGWSDWGYWGYWGYWGPYPETAFSTVYSGKVIANLQGPDAQRLRCRFHLNSPVAGMSGGGQGECQFSEGRTVDAVFPRT